VTYKGEDVTDVPTEFASSAAGRVDLLVVFTNRVTTLQGKVTDAGARAVARAWVFAFAEERPAELDNHSRDRMAVADDRGTFTLVGLVGDRYRIVAIDPAGQPPSPDLFRRAMPLAAPVSVTPGESRMIEVRAVILPPP
jgi:hypothetical protein